MKIAEEASLEAKMIASSLRAKSEAAVKKQTEALFRVYCSDVKSWALRLAVAVKGKNCIGLHPFMIEDSYERQEDKIAAVLMSAMIPADSPDTLRYINFMKSLLGDSPAEFLKNRYTNVDYTQFYKGLGCSGDRAQQWISILANTLLGPVDMIENNIFYFIKAREFSVTDRFHSSLSEALFWLHEHLLGTDKQKVPIADTPHVREFLQAIIPRWKMYGSVEEMTAMFDFEYPAMVFYAAEGRMRLYESYYDPIYRMEKNLKTKYKRGTVMDSFERHRFNNLFIKPLNNLIEAL